MWCLQILGVNTLSCLQYKNIIVDKNQSIPYFSPHCGIQCSIPSKVCPLRKRLSLLSCHENSSQIFDATKLWKHTIPLTYNTKTLISNISETHRFSPQMRLIEYPDHKTTHNEIPLWAWWAVVTVQVGVAVRVYCYFIRAKAVVVEYNYNYFQWELHSWSEESGCVFLICKQHLQIFP